MKTKTALSVMLLTFTTIALSSCNSVSFAIKTKGDEVQAAEWAECYKDSYESNLDGFQKGIFSGYTLSEDLGSLSSSFTLKVKKQTTSKNVTKSIGEKNTLKSTVNNKENATVTFDLDNNIYKQKVDKSNTKKTPQGTSYSDSESAIQYQKYQNNVYSFDLVNKTYSRHDLLSAVSVPALADSYLVSAYSTIKNIYDTLVAEGDSFGSSDTYKNDKFYVKGNVFTVITTNNYADTVSSTSGFEDIEGTVVYTRQYILEKSYITVTKYTEYKKCSWKNSSKTYEYKYSQEVGETFTLKLKGTVSKVYVDDFTFKS